MKPIHHKSVTTYVLGVEVVCETVVFYPGEPETQLEPPEPPMVEWVKVFINGIEVQDLFHSDLGDELECALIGQLEQ